VPGSAISRAPHYGRSGAAAFVLRGQHCKSNCDVIVGGETGGNADPILLPFLSASDETEAEDYLVDLLAHHALPIIEDVVSANLGPVESPKMESRVSQAQDAEDIVGEVVLKILDRLRRQREEPKEAAIEDFRRIFPRRGRRRSAGSP